VASPTEGEMDNQLRAGVLLIDNLLAQQTVATDEDAYVQILESDFAAAQAAGARLFRSRIASGVGAGPSVLSPILTAYTHHIVNAPERAAQAALDRIYAYFEANSKTVKSRGITYGAIPSFGASKGVLVRLSKDENAYDLENEFVETKTLRCIQDENTGAERFREVFELRGGNAGVDSLEADSSGAIRRNFFAKDSSSSLLRNSSFSQFAIAGQFAAGRYPLIVTDTITGWTLDDPTGYELDRNLFARDVVGDPNPTSLAVQTGAVRTVTQAFSVNRLQLAADVPYLTEVWVRPDAALTAGTLTIKWGSVTQAVTLSGLVAGAWNSVIVDRDEDLWAASFNQANAEFEFSFSGHDAEVLIDEVYFGTMEPFDGTWWHLSGSLASKFLLDDQIQVTDAFAGSDSKIQKWLWRAYGRYLPHSGAPTVTDP